MPRNRPHVDGLLSDFQALLKHAENESPRVHYFRERLGGVIKSYRRAASSIETGQGEHINSRRRCALIQGSCLIAVPPVVGATLLTRFNVSHALTFTVSRQCSLACTARPNTLHRNLLSTNAIENSLRNTRRKLGRVSRFRPETDQAQRWLAFALTEIESGFRKLSGHKDLHKLVEALEQEPATEASRFDQGSPPSPTAQSSNPEAQKIET